MKKLVTKYTIAIILGATLSTIALSLNGFFDTDVAIIQYKLLADAFSAPGMIMMLVPVLIWISGEGLFDGLTYALSSLGNMLTFRGYKKQEKFYDYKMRKAEKRMNSGYWFILFVGIGFMLISCVFLAIFYTNGGSDAYRVAIGM